MPFVIRHRAVAGALFCLWLAACTAATPPIAAKSAPPAVDAPHNENDSYPLSPQRLPTTDAAIYLGNLDALIRSHREFLASQDSAAHHAALAGALSHRFRVLGRLADGEAALQELERALALDPSNADAQLAHAAALSAFHRFDEADQALERARAAGANSDRIARIERDLRVAEGRYDLLADDLAHSSEPVADFYELAHRADLRLLQGDLNGATHWYRTAQDLYADVDPLSLAWLYTQQGIAFLRHHQYADAKVFFAAAHQRLPQFALATEHLAECELHLGQLQRSRELYRQVIEQTGNPEFIAGLAAVEDAAGADALAQSLRNEAERGYMDLLKRHRAAYAQHAAEFLLSINQAPRALALAQENLALRKDIGSWMLLARSADAAGEASTACQANQQARALGLHPPELDGLADLAQRCAAH